MASTTFTDLDYRPGLVSTDRLYVRSNANGDYYTQLSDVTNFNKNNLSSIVEKYSNLREFFGDLYLSGSTITIDQSYTDFQSIPATDLGLITSLANSSWYFLALSEVDYTYQLIDASTISLPSWAPNLANNQLDLLKFFDPLYNYCRFNHLGINRRLIYVFKTNNISSKFENFTVFKTLNEPKSQINISSAVTTPLLFDGIDHKVTMGSIFLDTHSSISGSPTTYTFNAKKTGIFHISYLYYVRVRNTSGVATWVDTKVRMNGVNIFVDNLELFNHNDVHQSAVTPSISPCIPINRGDSIEIFYNAGGGTIITSSYEVRYLVMCEQ